MMAPHPFAFLAKGWDPVKPAQVPVPDRLFHPLTTINLPSYNHPQ
jgi:hypothetical protein